MRFILIALTIMGTYNNSLACPTCIAQVNQNTPPFFSDEFYQATTEKTINSEQKTEDSL